MSKSILLFAAKTGYQVREFFGAAQRLGIELVLATDRCHILDDPWGDRATPLNFEKIPEPRDITALRERGPFDGVLAVGDRPAFIAAYCAERLGVGFHPRSAVAAANDKYETRRRFRSAGLNVPTFDLVLPGQFQARRGPCVLKPLHFSGSRGVIRADSIEEFTAAEARIRKMIPPDEPIVVEDFIPGREYALDGLISGGRLQTLAIFEKPDPLDGPFFEETIYVTPTSVPSDIQHEIQAATQRAANALGLCCGPIHAEMRVNSQGVWMLEAAARPIGGLCSRVLRFSQEGAAGETGLEEILLRHALGEDVSNVRLAPGAHGVMMIPIPRAGVFFGVDGIAQARAVKGIEAVEITAKEGQFLAPLPEGASYLGFIFARSDDAGSTTAALREAHACLEIHLGHALAVIN